MIISHQTLLRKILINANNKRSDVWLKLFKGRESTYKKRHSFIINYLKERFNDLNEAFLILRDNMDEYPKCKICGKPTYYHGGVFKEYCCGQCAGKGRAENERKKRNSIIPQNIKDLSDVINYKRYDNMILRLFIDKSCRGERSYWYNKFIGSPKYLNKYMNIKSYFLYRYKDITQKRNLCADFCNEVFLRLENNLEETPKCPMCGKPVGYSIKSVYYYNYCSRSCKMTDPATREYIHNASLIKFGSINNAQKISDTWKSHTKEQNDLAIQHRRETNVANGHDPNWTNVEKMIETNLMKWCVTCTLLHPVVHQKVVDYYMNTYGVEHQSQVPEIIDKIKQSLNEFYDNLRTSLSQEELTEYYNIIHEKSRETIKKRGKCKYSKDETKTYDFIKGVFPDAIHSYNDKRYARADGYEFECDIYIPSKDVFIECQYHPAHGRHAYDPNNDEFDEMNYIFNSYKMRNTPEHKRLQVFLTIDPMKRQIAKDNNLNYFELWKARKMDFVALCRQIKKLPNV